MDRIVPIEGFPHYFISDSGYYFSDHGGPLKILTPCFINSGYVQAKLRRDGRRHLFLVHRLVAIAFIPNPDNLPEVNHLDGDKLNNAVYNLGWCSKKQNVRHAFDTGLMDNFMATAGGKKLSPVHQYSLSGEFIKGFPTINAAAKSIARSRRSLYNVLIGKNKTCAGFKWERVNETKK